ncbi:MAG TPA: MFS transporter [Rhabdochlamydiaceae bacterium]|nr:MFS transporter [Rhabdochlamydiaceae bacterium]
MKIRSLFTPMAKSLMLLWVGHLFMDFCTGIWPIYKTVAKIDIAQAGLIAGISGFSGEILQIVFGYFCDRGYRKKILILGLILASSILWITFVKGIFNSFLVLLLLMLGSGSFHPAATGIAGSLSQTHKGKIILFFASGGAIGLGISQLVFTNLMEKFNGHAYILFIPLLLIIFAIVYHQFPDQKFIGPSTSIKGFFEPIMHCRKPLLLLYLSQVSIQGLMLAFMFLLPDLLRDRSCHSWLCMGGGHLCFILGSALTMVPAGYLCDKYGQKSVMLVVLCCATVLLYLFLANHSLSVGLTILLLSTLGAFLGIINPIIVSWGNRLVPQNPSTVSAILMGFAWCLSNFGPTSAGIISGYFNENAFVNAIAILGLSLVLIFFCTLFMPQLAKEPATLPTVPEENNTTETVKAADLEIEKIDK